MTQTKGQDQQIEPDIVSIARASYEAYVVKDRTAIEKLIADDFRFTSPLDNRIYRATYFQRCWKNSEKAEGFDFINLVPADNRVLVTYEGRIDGRPSPEAKPGGFLAESEQ